MIDYDSLVKKPKIDFKIILVAIVALILVVYTVDLMFFSQNSFSKMIDLNSELKILNKRVVSLKKKNQILQKEYFELKELEGNWNLYLY